jgi:hypothetical protein
LVLKGKEIEMKKKVLGLGLLALLLLASCTDEEASRKALYSAGYTDVALTGYAFFGCGQDDTYATKFRAKNPQGNRVEGVVCCGFFGKGCTVRF